MSTPPSSFFSRMLLCFALILLLMLFGCGKKGVPQPDDARDKFAWADTSMQAGLNGCLSVTGTLSGQVANLTDVVLEIQPIADDDDCVGCPFTPTERMEFSERTLRGHPEVNTIRLNYCPREETPSYRWRLIGINVHRRFPYEVTPVKLFTIHEEPETQHAPFYLP